MLARSGGNYPPCGLIPNAAEMNPTPEQQAPLQAFFSKEELDQAKRRVVLHHSLRKELESTEKKSGGLGELLRSELGKWLISTLLVGTLLPLAWTKMDLFGTERKLNQEKQAAARRDDSKFIADMLPFLTNSKRAVRARALDVLTTRYDTIPPAVQRLMAHALQDGETLYVAPTALSRSSAADAGTKRILNRFARSLAAIPKAQKDSVVQSVIRQIPATTLHRIDTLPPRPFKTVGSETGVSPEARGLSFADIRREAKQPDGQHIRLVPKQPGEPITLELYEGHPTPRGLRPDKYALRAGELLNPGVLQVIDTYETSHSGYKWLRIKTRSNGQPVDAWFSWGTREYATVRAD
jgi:hypothetical protein